MFKAAICDDESCFRQTIQELICNYLSKNGILYQIDTFCSGEDFLSSGIAMINYTVVFLDINMSTMDGITVAKKIRSLSKEVFIVFITAHVDYALEGYKVNAIRYVIKDNNQKKFQDAISECLDSVIEKMNYVVVRKMFGFKEGTKEISLERIIYIESNLHKTFFHVIEDEFMLYTLYDTLDSVEEKLADNNFIRIHQSYLVNLKYVKSILRYKAILYDGTELVIPKIRYMQVKEAFISYHGEV